MAEAQKQDAAAANETTAKEVALEDVMAVGIRGAKSEEQEQNFAKAIQAMLAELPKDAVVSKDAQRTLTALIDAIDESISKQLNEVMHAPEFQQLEASWRGLNYLVDKTETGEYLKIRVLNASKKDIIKDMDKAAEFDQSALFKKIYTEEFGQFGGDPYGVLIGDYEFGGEPQDVKLLEDISGVAASAHAPFISAAHPALFNLDSFADIGAPRDLAKIFDNKNEARYVKWRSFRDSEDSRYVGLTLPHVLMREPYGPETVPVETFKFEEDVDGRDHNKYLWGNAAYAMGARITDAFSNYHWCAAIRGVEGGGKVEGLPTHSFRTDAGEVALKCPTEVAIADRREKELADLGFISLAHCKGTDYAAFFGTQSANRPKQYDKDAATKNAKMSAGLQYIFATCRIAHYLKAMMRDKVGSFMTKENCADFLNTWIAQYILLDDSAGQESKAQKPLREARIDVVEDPAAPGVYKAVAFLKPHFQLEELTVSLRLVAELPPPVN